MSVSKLRSCCTNSPLPFETYNLWTSALEWRIFGIRRSFNFFARRLSTAHFSTLVGSGDHFHFINHSPPTRDLQTFLLFFQYYAAKPNLNFSRVYRCNKRYIYNQPGQTDLSYNIIAHDHDFGDPDLYESFFEVHGGLTSIEKDANYASGKLDFWSVFFLKSGDIVSTIRGRGREHEKKASWLKFSFVLDLLAITLR